MGVFILEVPSGYFADLCGRRLSLILAAFFWVLGFASYALAKSFLGFALAELLLAVGVSLRSGTDTALVYDSLKAGGLESEYTRYQGRVELATRIGAALASVLGGVLAVRSLELPVYLNIMTAVAMFAMALTFFEPARSKPPHQNPFKGMGLVIVRSLHDARLFLPMLLSGIMTSVGLIAIWSYFLLFQHDQLSTTVTGVIFAVFQLTSGFGARWAARLEGWLGERTTWTLFAAVGGGLVAIGLWPSAAVCAGVMVANAFVWGISGPLLMTRINERTSSDTRATVISVASMIGRVLYALVAPVVGLVADRVALSTAFVGLGGAAMVGTLAVLLIYWRALRTPRSA